MSNLNERLDRAKKYAFKIVKQYVNADSINVGDVRRMFRDFADGLKEPEESATEHMDNPSQFPHMESFVKGNSLIACALSEYHATAILRILKGHPDENTGDFYEELITLCEKITKQEPEREEILVREPKNGLVWYCNPDGTNPHLFNHQSHPCKDCCRPMTSEEAFQPEAIAKWSNDYDESVEGHISGTVANDDGILCVTFVHTEEKRHFISSCTLLKPAPEKVCATGAL